MCWGLIPNNRPYDSPVEAELAELDGNTDVGTGKESPLVYLLAVAEVVLDTFSGFISASAAAPSPATSSIFRFFASMTDSC